MKLLRTHAVIFLATLVAAACSDKSDTPGSSTQAAAPSSGPHDYLAVSNRPNSVHLIDLSTNTVVRSCDLPGDYGGGTLQMAADKHTAYVLSNRFEAIYGVDLDNCTITFSAVQSEGDVRVKTIGAFALSPDGSELYVHQSPVRLLRDRYEVMDTRLAVYRTADGQKAKPVRTFPVARQVILAQTGADGTLYLAGQDVLAMDVKTGETRIAIASLHPEDPTQGQRDVLSTWPIGTQSGEFIRMYTAARFPDATHTAGTERLMWGYERIDLATGAAESRDFGPLEEVLFSGMTRPGKRNEMFAVLTRLKKYDVEKQQLLASVDLEHSYYCVNFSSDGSKVYLAGTFNDIAIYDADKLTKIGNIQLPGGDMALTTAQVFNR